MPNATGPYGDLKELKDCYIKIPEFGDIRMYALPDISESKSAAYNDEAIMGRSFPLKTFSHSENRSISMQLHFFVTKQADINQNLLYLRALESCVYPRTSSSGLPFKPPAVCKIRCGKLLSDDYGELCVVLKSYSVKFPTEVAWDEEGYVPYKFDVDTSWDVVYRSENLPGAEKIMSFGS